MPDRRFPAEFLWGAATSCFQIEGATQADGRGESIWDRLCTKPGAIADGSHGDPACDHYHRWEADLDIMAALGLQAYRFSVSWPRILPEGTGRIETRGLDFYDRLVDGLLARSITPCLTLYHWDLPQTLQDAGGWPARTTAAAFADYADVVSKRLGDRVKFWITHNEPWCIATLGHAVGEHAPGHTSVPEALATSHHLNLSHGWAVPIIRANSPGAKVGITLNLTPAVPASPSAEDAEACALFDGRFNRWYLDPIYGRGYPEDILAHHIQNGDLPSSTPSWLKPGDLKTAATPTDFLGVNYYSRAVVRSERIAEKDNAPRSIPEAPDERRTDMGWEVYSQGLVDILTQVHRDYPAKELYVTENGAAYSDEPNAEGRVTDERRIHFLHDHLVAAHQAIAQGIPLRGYFLWSLLDNFEWAHGYEKRFGIVHVDYATQLRTMKDSARWYSKCIATNSVITRK